MFNAHNAIVSRGLQSGDHFLPFLFSGAVPHGAENPSTVFNIAIMFGVQDTDPSCIVGIDPGIFGMEMIDGTLQHPNTGHRVNTLPDQMAGIKISADFRADGLAQSQQRLRIIDTESRMHLQGNLFDAVGTHEGDSLFPIGDELFIPLIVKNCQKIIGPRAGNPVGILGIIAVSGAAGKGHNRFDPQLFRQQNGILEILFCRLGDVLLWVDGIRMGAQGADIHMIVFQPTLQLFDLGIVIQIDIRVKVSFSGRSATAQLQRLDAQATQIFHRVFQVHTIQGNGQYS